MEPIYYFGLDTELMRRHRAEHKGEHTNARPATATLEKHCMGVAGGGQHPRKKLLQWPTCSLEKDNVVTSIK